MPQHMVVTALLQTIWHGEGLHREDLAGQTRPKWKHWLVLGNVFVRVVWRELPPGILPDRWLEDASFPLPPGSNVSKQHLRYFFNLLPRDHTINLAISTQQNSAAHLQQVTSLWVGADSHQINNLTTDILGHLTSVCLCWIQRCDAVLTSWSSAPLSCSGSATKWKPEIWLVSRIASPTNGHHQLHAAALPDSWRSRDN